MFLVLAFLLLVVWLIAVGPFGVTAASVHVLLGLVVASVMLHFVHVRKYRSGPSHVPKNATK